MFVHEAMGFLLTHQEDEAIYGDFVIATNNSITVVFLNLRVMNKEECGKGYVASRRNDLSIPPNRSSQTM